MKGQVLAFSCQGLNWVINMSGSESPDFISQRYTAKTIVNVQLRDHCYKIFPEYIIKKLEKNLKKHSAYKYKEHHFL